MRVSEIYTSVQGEGPDVGTVTQFVRFAGCNLRCPGWPCDTQHAIDPAKYRHEWKQQAAHAIAGDIRRMSNNGHVTLTGGEPFLQPSQELDALTQVYLHDITFNIFTNGTLPFPEWINQQRVKVIMDWKLPGSGEDGFLDTRIENLGLLTSKDSVKFVCADEDDFDTACNLVTSEYPKLFQCVGNIYVGAVWGKIPEADLAGWLIDSGHDFKLNVQVHNYVWDRNKRGI
jgi:7-carboxy-7-deazaguanine synthase